MEARGELRRLRGDLRPACAEPEATGIPRALGYLRHLLSEG